MSNSFTAVVIEVLAIAMSSLAANDAERALTVHIAGHDQNKVGSGCVGFDVCEISWTRERLEQEKAFLIAGADAAIAKLGWERLDYEPNHSHVAPMLQKFTALIEAVKPEDIRLPRGKSLWDYPAPEGFPRCERHGIYLHPAGCVAC